MLELLAEVAVLEEEVVRLEELVVNVRQGLYQEAVYTSSRRNGSNSAESPSDISRTVSRRRHTRSFSQSEVNLESSPPTVQSLPSLSRCSSSRKLLSPDSDSTRYRCDRNLINGEQLLNRFNSPLDDRVGKENKSLANSIKDKSLPTKKSPAIKPPVQLSPVKPQSIGKCADPSKIQVQCDVDMVRLMYE